MRNRSDYKICPLCGASLDVGEVCDCQKEKERYNKVSVCVYPYKYGCRGCNYNSVPALHDGGCLLLKGKRTECPPKRR